MNILVSKLPTKDVFKKSNSSKNFKNKNNKFKKFSKKNYSSKNNVSKNNKSKKSKEEKIIKDRYIVSITTKDENLVSKEIRKGFPTRLEATEYGFNYQLKDTSAKYEVHKKGYYKNLGKTLVKEEKKL